MSGGMFDYKQQELAYALFGYDLSLNYGKDGFNQSKQAADINPLGNKVISEMLWDMLCLIQSKDWCDSGDINLSTYSDDIKFFVNKWFKLDEEKLKDIYVKYLENYAEYLIDEFKSMSE